jgi:transcription antitermination factor NusG
MPDAATVQAADAVLPYVEDVFTIDSPRRRWYVLVTAPQAERRVQERSEHLGNPVYVPVAKTFRADKPGRLTNPVSERSLFPGYAFVNLPVANPPFSAYVDEAPAGLAAITTAGYAFPASSALPIGGIAFVSNNGRPEHVEDDVIARLKKREAAGEFDETGLTDDGRYTIPKWIKRGKTIRTIDGPLVGYHGSISRAINSKIVSVWLTIFGRTTLTDMPIAFIERYG